VPLPPCADPSVADPAGPMQVRDARPEDAPAVRSAYALGIVSRQATFETTVPSVQELADRIAGTHSPHRFLVTDGGWAATSAYSTRAAYRGVAEFSVYVERQRSGVGRLLLTELLRLAEQDGLHKVTSRVFTDNVASRALCAAVGFREVGVHLRHAQLDGVWKDCVTVEALLGPARLDGLATPATGAT
jgi:L-amino acid N-acyltransferase YncA